MNKLKYRREKARLINEKLKEEFPNPTPPLVHANAHELLFAVILSAQTTDIRVNQVTQKLFMRYKTVEDYAQADVHELEEIVRIAGLYKNKAKNIKAAAQKILTDYDGEVPDSMEELVKLPGVGRKTASVVLGQWFHKNEGFAVDTHVKRIAWKMDLTDHKEPEKIEQDLMRLFPREEWTDASLRIIFHGRTTCPARLKLGEQCSLGDLCSRSRTLSDNKQQH